MQGHASQSETQQLADDARMAGLRKFATPSLEAVERRRWQLWSVVFVVLVGLSAVLVVLSFWEESLPSSYRDLASLPLLRICFLALTVGFCLYVVEKEARLRAVTRALIDERVLSAALANRVHEFTLLSGVGRAVNSILEPQEVLEIILSSALNLSGAADGGIMLADLRSNALRSVCAKDCHGRVIVTSQEVLVGEGLAGWVAQHRRPLLVSAAHHPDLFARLDVGGPGESDVRAAMCVPLVHRDALLGVLWARERSWAGEITEYDLRTLELFAEHAAVAISNARLFAAERAHVARLQMLDEQRSEFVAMVSHELRSPLTSIIGAAQTLRKRLPGAAEDEADASGELLNVIERQGDRLVRLIDDILMTSRLEAGSVRIDLRPVALASLIGNVLRVFESRPGANRLRLAAPRDRQVLVLADEHALEQVLINLVDNALKYAPGEAPVTITISEIGDETAVTVADCGPGIPAEDLPHVFDRFRRGRDSGSSSGSGLGLYITANLVAAMGGRIWAQSEVGQGTSFTFTLGPGAPGDRRSGYSIEIAQQPLVPEEAPGPVDLAPMRQGG